MKKKLINSLLVYLILQICNPAWAQSGKVPPFRMIQSDNKIFKAENLPFEKPIIIIYFSPDCDDCQQLTKDILSHMGDLKNVSIAMITYLGVDLVTHFVERNNLKKFSNIYVGTEGNSLFLKTYYNIEHFPFLALYNKNGDLIKKYSSKEIDVKDLLTRLKNL
jgi:thioredoxin-related protein